MADIVNGASDVIDWEDIVKESLMNYIFLTGSMRSSISGVSS